jgi:hypothetical protein
VQHDTVSEQPAVMRGAYWRRRLRDFGWATRDWLPSLPEFGRE